MKKNEKYQEFCNLISRGVSRPDIIKILSISPRTYDNYNKKHEDEKLQYNSVSFPFDLKLYFDIMTNCDAHLKNKDDIAKKLGVSKKTLIFYERKHIFPNFARWLKLVGYGNNDIKEILKIKSKEDILSYLENYVSFDDVLSSISTLKEYLFFQNQICNVGDADFFIDILDYTHSEIAKVQKMYKSKYALKV